MRLRSYLITLTLMTVIPVAVFATLVGYFLVEQNRETLLRAAEERTLALLSRMEAELKGTVTTLEALAVVPSLLDGDLKYFGRAARNVLATQADWANINLALPDRTRIYDLVADEATPLPPITDDGELSVLLRERRPVIAGIALGPTSKSWNFAVRVPVIEDGAVRYVLSAVVRPDVVARLVAAQNLPEGAVAAVLDHNNRVVARTLQPDEMRGRVVSERLRQALARSSSGRFRGETREGLKVYTSYRRSPTSGWTFVLGVPASVVDAAVWRAAGLLGIGLLGAVALAFVLSHVVGRRIATPIASLAAATEAIGRGERVPVPQEAAIAEVGVFARTLQESINALRANEERVRMALEAGRMGSWQWDVRTGEVKWSAELEAIHGMAPGSFGGNFAAFRAEIHPDDRGKVERAVAESLEAGRSEHHLEYRIVRPDGAVRWVEGRGAIFRDPSGAALRLVGVCTDVTERKRAEEAMRGAARAKDEFLAMLSHELRNPLAALSAAAHVLRIVPPAAAAAAQARDVVERQAAHMARLIEDLLDTSRITMGKLALEREVFDLARLVAGVVHEWRVSGRLGGHRVELECDPVWANADRARMEQIVSNLLDNAAKFTPAGGCIRVSVRKENGEALLQVSDTGRGIAPEALERVFEPFVQAKQALHRSEGGLGLGLALVKRLVELHGGSVAAASAGQGQGAAFTVRLAAVAPPEEERVPAPQARTQPGGPRRILVIEDNADSRAMLRATLALEGHQVSEASSGEAGIVAAARTRPDVALIDIGLPDIDGYEVARRLRAEGASAHIGLVAITGYGQDDDVQRARDAGFDSHLTKPVAPERLARVIAGLP